MTTRTTIMFGLLAIFATACGAESETSTGGVTSVSDLDETLEDVAAVVAEREANQPATTVATSTESAGPSGDEPATAEEAVLALSACMRDNGWEDFPDPTFDAAGNPQLRQAVLASGIDFSDPAFREQIDVCVETSGADRFGTGNRAQQQNQLQERLLGYTQCLRDEGLDVGDVDPTNPGAGNGQAARPGQARGNIGTVEGRSSRVAQFLGLDPDDPDTGAALEACDAELVAAFAGGPGGAPPTTQP